MLGAGNKTVNETDSSKACLAHNRVFFFLLEDLHLSSQWLSAITLYIMYITTPFLKDIKVLIRYH